MKYISVDIETTGLGANADIVEVGIVADSWEGDRFDRSHDLCTFQAYVDRPKGSVGQLWDEAEPYALGMHEASGLVAKWWGARPLGDLSDKVEGVRISADRLCAVIKAWLFHIGFLDPEEERLRVNAAGKNVAQFDWPRLRKLPNWDLPARHRMLDPGPLYLRPREDQVIPDLATCLQRAGAPSIVTHNAVEDAMQVVWLLRHHYLGQKVWESNGQ